MGKLAISLRSFAVVFGALALIVNGFSSPAAATGDDSRIDNVAVQWNYLFSQILCRTTGVLAEPNIIFAQFHLAQWHALIAHKHTGACTTQEIVVAYASHKILSNYFPFEQNSAIDPLLAAQLKALRGSDSAQKLGKQLGEAVALDLIATRTTAREFALQALKRALDAEADAPRPGLYRYLNNTPAGRDAATFVFHDIPVARPYVIPEPSAFIRSYLCNLKPPKVPSDEWDEEYEKTLNLGRADWPGRTAEMNATTALLSCSKVNSITCWPAASWSAIIRATLPRETSLYDTVTLFAKLSVALHDVLIVLTTLQYGFWFWRPVHAYRDGDPRHAPIPDWNSWLSTPSHAEYPSGTVAVNNAAATTLENFFGKGVAVPFVLPGQGVFGPTCPVQGPIPNRRFGSFAELARAHQEARVYAGVHFNISVVDGMKVGESVANYVEKNWEVKPPSGVLPSPVYLKLFAELPKKQTGFNPIKLIF